MILGDKNRFAVEFEIDSDPCGISIYGQCCLWIGGDKLGNYNLITRLGDVFHVIHRIVKDCGKRNSNWIDLDAREIFCKLNEILYLMLYNGEVYNDVAPAAYDVRINTESFDGLKIFLLDCDILISRLIYSRNEGITVKEVRLVPGEFDSVVKRFYIELDKLYEEAKKSMGVM